MLLTLAHSPDTDDIFMAVAMKESKVDSKGLRFSFTSEEIQSLNEKALHETFDVTAISIGVYPLIQHAYYLVPIGASIGHGVGPALVSLRGKKAEWGPRATVVYPGHLTSAFLAAQDLLPAHHATFCSFDEVTRNLEEGKADYGLLIHEAQMDSTRPKHLEKVADLGALWMEKFQCPLPLGANAIRKALPPPTVQKLLKILEDSICYGWNNQDDVLKKALQETATPLKPEEGVEYLNRYVNHNSLKWDDSILKGVRILLNIGKEKGLLPVFDEKNAFFQPFH